MRGLLTSYNVNSRFMDVHGSSWHDPLEFEVVLRQCFGVLK